MKNNFNHYEYLSFLYVFRVKSPTCGTEYIKIGKTTKSLLERFAAHSTGSPYVLNIHRTFRFKEKITAALHENELHKKMRDYLVKGEWFIYNEESIICLNKSLFNIKENHYDVRKDLLPLTRIIPNIDYGVNELPFTVTLKEIKDELAIKNK